MFPSKRLEEYDHLDPKHWAKNRNGQEDGDPAKGSLAIYLLGTMRDPPLRVALEGESLIKLMAKIEGYQTWLKNEKLKNLALSCDIESQIPTQIFDIAMQ